MGAAKRVLYPAPLVLSGVTLPWRESAVHLGHKLHQDLSFSSDAAVRRATFISRSVNIRNQFAFSNPAQILTAVKILCCDAYGAVLWKLDTPYAASFFKSCSSSVRRIHRLPLNTFTYLVEGHLTAVHQGLSIYLTAQDTHISPTPSKQYYCHFNLGPQ